MVKIKVDRGQSTSTPRPLGALRGAREYTKKFDILPCLLRMGKINAEKGARPPQPHTR
jgi:hypothetical protein